MSSLGTCGCCVPSQQVTPALVYNRPALTAVAYRIGAFGAFRRAMATSLQRDLGALTARDPSDFAIAVTELGAYIFDIITFYSERSINEALLRTAVHVESVRKLAALLDYRPLPGVAASALLAVTLEAGRKLVIPVGLRVQSVPEQDQKPQKFETVEGLTADAAFNRFAILPVPIDHNALGAAESEGLLASGPEGLGAGTAVVAFTEGAAGVEDKEIAAVRWIGSRVEVQFTPAMSAARTKMFAWKRKFRLFGIHAPRTTITSEPVSPGSSILKFTTEKVTSDTSGNTVFLDGVVDDIGPNARVLLASDSIATVRHVTAVTQELANVKTQTAVVTALTLDGAAIDSYPIASATIYELEEEAITFKAVRFANEIAKNTTLLATELAVEVGSRLIGRTLILDDEVAEPQSVEVTGVSKPDDKAVSKGDVWTRVTVSPGLDRIFKTPSASGRGNVVSATHGETVKDEILGDGDASKRFQEFRLAKAPLTYVPDADAPNGAGSTLAVRVNGVLWEERGSLSGQAPAAHVFIARRDEKERTTVRFGDSVTGARALTGRANLTGTYRVGIGTVANLAAGAIRNPLDRPAGLKSVVNPLPSTGGADPEDIVDTRRNAPNTVRTFDRIVSIEDIATVALEFAGVEKATVALEWSGEEQVAFLTVAGVDGAVISGPVRDNLLRYLNARRDINRALVIRGHSGLPFKVHVRILTDPAYVAETVRHGVHDTIVDFFSFDRQSFGRPVFLSELATEVQNVEGVVGVDFERLRYKASSVPEVHNRLAVPSNKIATIENPDADVDVTLGLS